MFRPDNATAMAVYFLMCAPNHALDDLVLMKLMVIAERRCMAETTSLISGATFVSMQNGPVLSEVLDLMQGQGDSPTWSRHIKCVPHGGHGTASNHCILREGLDVEEYLSDFEIELLASVWGEYKKKSKWDLVEITHTFPEWDESSAETKSSSPISLKSIFELGLHQSPDVAQERANEIEYFEALSD